jgi:hypothetical protein
MQTTNYSIKSDYITRFLTSGFFHESVTPRPLSIPMRSFRFFKENSRRYSQLNVISPVSTTPAINVKVCVVDPGEQPSGSNIFAN